MSINRRFFVQSAVGVLGGTATVAGDVAAQTRMGIAGSYPTTSPIGPFKPSYDDTVGDQAQRYYLFLKDLFDSSKNYRKTIWEMSDKELRDLLKNKLNMDFTSTGKYPNVKIMIVDIGNGRAKFSDGSDCTVTGCAVSDLNAAWYTLVLPPLPIGHMIDGIPQPGYLMEMAWESAWHHAIVYGYGM